MPRRKKRPIQHAEVVVRFGMRLREVRLSRGMTQAELGRQANVSVAYVGRLEQGKAAVGLDLLDRLASALGCTVADLLPAAATPPDTDAVLKGQIRRLLDTLLDSADQAMLLLLSQLLARLSGAIR
jgi:XRE family aerobic/anaerobic benzoate catabolism transcriptional regulator